ncbi:unnamed protein product [Urochloa humidicola]
MGAELLELHRQLDAAQSASSSMRLSERNVVKQLQKLQERCIIDFNLFHTAFLKTSGLQQLNFNDLSTWIRIGLNFLYLQLSSYHNGYNLQDIKDYLKHDCMRLRQG